MKHTKGPWQAQPTTTGAPGFSDIWCPDSEADNSISPLAHCKNQDAAIIAAAPELLEALESLVSEVEYDVQSELKAGRPVPKAYRDKLQAARDAIAKAKGVTSD